MEAVLGAGDSERRQQSENRTDHTSTSTPGRRPQSPAVAELPLLTLPPAQPPRRPPVQQHHRPCLEMQMLNSRESVRTLSTLNPHSAVCQLHLN